MSVFKEARIKADLSVEDVSSRLNIRKHYIIAIEENRFSDIPSGVYAQGYIKMYAKLLGIDSTNLLVAKSNSEENDVYKNGIDFVSKNNIGIATFIIVVLIVISWFYIAIISNNKRVVDVVQDLENLEPANYMLNISNTTSDKSHSTNENFKLPNIEGVLDGLNEQNNK